MVDDINFPRGLPPVAASGRIQKVNRKKHEEEKPPFEKFLNQEDPEEKNKNKKKKATGPEDNPDIIENRGNQNYIESSSSTGAVEAEDNAEGKIIDVLV